MHLSCICQYVVDTFQLSSVGSTRVLPLEARLFHLLRATIPPLHVSDPLELDDILGCDRFAITVRRLKGKKPEGVSA